MSKIGPAKLGGAAFVIGGALIFPENLLHPAMNCGSG